MCVCVKIYFMHKLSSKMNENSRKGNHNFLIKILIPSKDSTSTKFYPRIPYTKQHDPGKII